MEDDAACMLVVIGATPEGKTEPVGFQVGVRESAQSWRELLVDLKPRGIMSAARTWRRLKGENRLPRVIAGVKSTDGVAISRSHGIAARQYVSGYKP